MKMRLLVFSIFLMISFSVIAGQVEIVGWNLKGLDIKNRIGIREENLQNIINGMKSINGMNEVGARIFVLTEVNPAARARQIAQALSEENCKYNSVTPPQEVDIKISIVYSCKVLLSSFNVIKGSNLNGKRLRNIITANVAVDKFDFIIAGVHLKSGRDKKDRDLRNSQLRYLRDHIKGIYLSGEKDVIVIGDYNMIPRGKDEENFKTLNSDKSLRFVSSEFKKNTFSHIRRGKAGNLLDGIGFSIIDEQEYVKGSARIIMLHEIMNMDLSDFSKKVTDHLPIAAIFKTSTDHDQ